MVGNEENVRGVSLWLRWGQSPKCHGTSGFGGVLLCVDSNPAPPSLPFSTPTIKKEKKKKERKNRKVSLEDYCHTAVTVTVPCGQYGGGIGGGRMVGWGGGGQLNTTPLPFLSHSLSLSLSPPLLLPNPLLSLVISSPRGER